MKLNNGFGSGIGYKTISYRSNGTIAYDSVPKFQTARYSVPNYNYRRYDYNLIFNLNAELST